MDETLTYTQLIEGYFLDLVISKDVDVLPKDCCMTNTLEKS